jgi:hypothetical protein
LLTLLIAAKDGMPFSSRKGHFRFTSRLQFLQSNQVSPFKGTG